MTRSANPLIIIIVIISTLLAVQISSYLRLTSYNGKIIIGLPTPFEFLSRSYTVVQFVFDIIEDRMRQQNRSNRSIEAA